MTSSITTLLSGCVESLRISEVYAAQAAHETELQKEFEDLKKHPTYITWSKISRSAFLRASENAALWKQRAYIEWLEAKKMGYTGKFDRLAIAYNPPLAAAKQ